MELNDKEFDDAFRRKVFDADPQFEDEAWDKMERKLKRRDQIIFFRKSALVLFALLAGAWGYFALDQSPIDHADLKAGKKRETLKVPVDSLSISAETQKADHKVALNSDIRSTAAKKEVDHRASSLARRSHQLLVKTLQDKKTVEDTAVDKAVFNKQLAVTGTYAGIVPVHTDLSGLKIPATIHDAGAVRVRGLDPIVDKPVADKKLVFGNRRNMPISLAVSAGPEFNSASSVVGGDPGFSAGLTVGFGITKKLDLQTGVRYSVKKYNSGPGIRYDFPNTGTWIKYNLTNLDASCNVLEIPLQASYNVVKKGGNMLNLNAGISSYLMLKEDYEFKYNTPYGAADKVLQKRNANQHLFSIVDLSATYFIKLKSTNLKLGLEPFVKIPLSGVGEGNINLKSSGVSLKLRYDLEKKNN